MLGLLLPSRGNIYFKNENILKDISLWYDNVSIVSQEPHFYLKPASKIILHLILKKLIQIL